MIKVSLYIYINGIYKRLELFNDEKINITSSIQNINDISKTFTDYTQTFSVPATTNNNAVFSYWYNNDVDNGFDQRKRADAYIELDSISFKNGKIQLESVDLKSGQPDNYKITFFGSLVSLKDTFNGLLLKDLNLNTSYDITYTPDVVKNLVTTTSISSDVMFPLISSKNIWTYGSGTTYDISNSATPINYFDLFPAIKLSSVFNMIQSQFGINFSGSFLTNNKFLNAYLWLKNSELFSVKVTNEIITFDSYTGGTGFNIDLVNDSFSGDGSFCTAQIAYLEITPTVAGLTYNIHTSKNGVDVLVQPMISTTSMTSIPLTAQTYGGFGLVDKYSVYISAPAPITFNAQIILTMSVYDSYGAEVLIDSTITKYTSQTTTAVKLAIKDYFPEIKIEDFFSGVLRQFNLTCFSTEQDVYNIETLEDYYSSGKVLNITKHIIRDVQSIERVKTFNKVNFSYEKSENVISANFLSTYSRSFGDLLQDFDSDGSEYAIKLPFECLSYNKISGNLITGYAVKYDLKQYIPKPIILYDLTPTSLTSCPSFYFTGSSSGSYVNYKCFSNETIISSVYNSLAWGSENSLMTSTIPISLYQNYYQSYLENVFNEKARLFKCKAMLPISIITNLTLKDLGGNYGRRISTS